MRSLYKNLIKSNFTGVKNDEKRVIDSNTRIAERLELLREIMQTSENATFQDGFVEGLYAENVDDLLRDTDEEGMDSTGEFQGGIGQHVVVKAQPAVEVQPQIDVEAMVREAEEEIERMKQNAAAEIEYMKQEAYESAKKQGYEDGVSEGNRLVEQKLTELELKEKQLEQMYDEKITELEPLFVDTLSGIYEHIFHVDLKNHRGIIMHLITNTIRKIEGSRDFIIRVSKEDFPYVSMQKKQLVTSLSSANSSVEIVEDVLLAKNECLIETDSGIFDCSLGVQLAELEKELKLLSYTNYSNNVR